MDAVVPSLGFVCLDVLDLRAVCLVRAMVWCLCLTLLLCVGGEMARIVCVVDFGGIDLSVGTTNSSVSDALQIQPNFGKLTN